MNNDTLYYLEIMHDLIIRDNIGKIFIIHKKPALILGALDDSNSKS